MGAEFLDTDRPHVYRAMDAEEFRRLERRAWTLAQVKAEPERNRGGHGDGRRAF